MSQVKTYTKSTHIETFAFDGDFSENQAGPETSAPVASGSYKSNYHNKGGKYNAKATTREENPTTNLSSIDPSSQRELEAKRPDLAVVSQEESGEALESSLEEESVESVSSLDDLEEEEYEGQKKIPLPLNQRKLFTVPVDNPWPAPVTYLKAIHPFKTHKGIDSKDNEARKLQSEKLINLLKLVETSQVNIDPIMVFSHSYQAARKDGQESKQVSVQPTSTVFIQLLEYLSYTSQCRAHSSELFDHTRLLAHPTLPISIWIAVSKSSASGASTVDIYISDLKAAGVVIYTNLYKQIKMKSI
ncbi:uncharacterized protein MELLADRAFT_101753 [Melampsora larici-populina 98AG31]|uniref:Uncharacterized protein n=1 Tax=Melampsora larici-populina (strain 98AG31 / pathotype 3-4-7) TaxID=747676 RepID=F4R6U8_MELLP|nr:uncharacterized protein MELLADRAFT_101753 [Melampsora larici-populina 98AG31]EGG12391.1 hypothetical protein MELLADRAFT_101753 [Melampsora larici-populina 98AG31]